MIPDAMKLIERLDQAVQQFEQAVVAVLKDLERQQPKRLYDEADRRAK